MHKALSTHRLRCALAAILIFAVGVPLAHATIINGTLHFTPSIINYTLQFTVGDGGPVPAGSSAWNTTTGTWNSFTVDWDGAVFNFAPFYPNPDTVGGGGSWCAAAPGNTTSSCAPPATFVLGFPIIPENPTFTDIFAGANGTFTVVENVSKVPTGSFSWNTTTGTWTSFTVDWDGAVFNFAPFYPNPDAVGGGGSWCAAAPGNTTSSCAPPATFVLGFPIIPESPTFTDIFAGANGTFTVTTTTTAVPEPGSLGLMMLGLGALFFGIGWRRLRHGHRPACA